MKKIFLILFLTPAVCLLHAQNLNFRWAKQMSGTGNGSGYSVATDAAGNVYTIGSFTGTTDFDPGSGTFYLTNTDVCVFISKLDAAGTFIWAKQIKENTTGQVWGTGITLDAGGNIYATGAFSGTVDFDPGPNVFMLSTIYPSLVTQEGFIFKLDAAGNFVWAIKMPGAGGDVSGGMSIVSDPAGNVYMSGAFGGMQDFDPGPGTLNIMGGYNNIYIAKFNAAGNFIWAKTPDVSSTGFNWLDMAYINLDATGNVYCTGDFAGTVDFDPGGGIFSLVASNWNIYIWKLTANGNFVWAKQMSGIDPSNGSSIATDAAGNIYSNGSFRGTVDFDPGGGVYNLTAGFNNMYISKLDASGNFIWAKQLGDLSTANTASGSSLKLDASANIYFTGNFTGTIDFDPGPGIYDLNAIGLYGDMFVLRLDKDGNFTSVKQMGGPGNQTNGLGLSLDAFGNIYTSGSFNGIVDFDPGTNTYNLSSTSENDIFVHKMAQCTNSTSSTLTVTDCKNYILNGITYTNSGVYTQTLVNTAGCDSLITLNLTINRVLATVNASSCNNYSWHGKTYNTSGDYIDTFITTGSCDSVITLHLTILPRAFSFITQSICSGQTYGGHNSSGTYIDTLVAANGCDSIITLQLTVLSKPVPYLGADTSLCAGQTLQLYPGSFTTYSWQDGSIQSHYTVKQPGLYSVIVSNNCGSARDDIQVIQNYCDIYFPQAFTPNKDGKNDVFKMLGALNITDYHLTIYNRYGQKIFETTDPAMGWTGEFKGKLQGNDTYAWQCNYNRSGLAQLLKGTIILLR